MPPSPLASSVHRRKLRGFIRWMSDRGIQYSDGLQFAFHDCSRGIVAEGLGVVAVYDLQEGDLIASIPKEACLTVRTTGAAEAIEDAQLGGGLALAVALMYERSRGEESPWYPYLHVLPDRQVTLPIVWDTADVDSFLLGTELHGVVQMDKKLIEEDWGECILPLCESDPRTFPAKYFTLEDYFSAKTLVSSRAFEVDEYHGYGMVPLADLFNHKTGAEDVHISNLHNDSDSDEKQSDFSCDEMIEELNEPESSVHASNDGSEDSLEDRSNVLDMILVRNVSRGSEVFNTYGNLSNAALLHRYGFTEPENPYDIVNIDYLLVMEYCTMLFKERHVRKRVRMLRKYGCVPCKSEDCEYFEVSACGKPQLELLCYLYTFHLSDCVCDLIDTSIGKIEVSGGSSKTTNWSDKLVESMKVTNNKTWRSAGNSEHGTGDLYEIFLTKEVCNALLWLCDRRDQAYGSTTLEEDQKNMESHRNANDCRFFNALALRVYERCILRKLHCLASERLRTIQGA